MALTPGPHSDVIGNKEREQVKIWGSAFIRVKSRVPTVLWVHYW